MDDIESKMTKCRETLKEVFGYDSFRPGQEELIRAVMSGQDAMGIMPTGGGKSICFQIPAVLLEGLTLVISPLVSLMRDQVLALKEHGVRAAFLNDDLSFNTRKIVLNRARCNFYQIMYVAPERLKNSEFQSFCQNYPIPFIAVDEAHCISQWGHNFRPDYQEIRQFINHLPKRPVVGAYTATATARVRKDIVESLGMNHPVIEVNGFDRPNLFFEVQSEVDKQWALERFLRGNQGKSGIVYCATRPNVEKVCSELQSMNYSVTRYHAKLNPEEKSQNQNDFLTDERKIMVATTAFGMGIDKPNVRFVVHYNMPKSIEDYYQEAGRAGRDGLPAHCLLLYQEADVELNDFIIRKEIERKRNMTQKQKADYLKSERSLLRQMKNLATSGDCLRTSILRYFGENRTGNCGNCGNCKDAALRCNSRKKRIEQWPGKSNGFSKSMSVSGHASNAARSYQRYSSKKREQISSKNTDISRQRMMVSGNMDMYSKARIVISCVKETEAAHGGLDHLTIRDILAGSDSPALKQRHLNKLPTYGKLLSQSGEQIQQVIQLAITRGWVREVSDTNGASVLKTGIVPDYLLNSNIQVTSSNTVQQEALSETVKPMAYRPQQRFVQRPVQNAFGNAAERAFTSSQQIPSEPSIPVGPRKKSAKKSTKDRQEAVRKKVEKSAFAAQQKFQQCSVKVSSQKTVEKTAAPRENSALFKELSLLRQQIAREKGVSQDEIFNDMSLSIISRRKPLTRQEFAACWGVDDTKTALYAERFLDVIRKFG